MNEIQPDNIAAVAKIIYDDFVGGLENETPTDEYVPEAKAILEYIQLQDKLPTELEINIALTRIFKDYLGYEFTEYQLETGALPGAADKIHGMLLSKDEEG